MFYWRMCHALVTEAIVIFRCEKISQIRFSASEITISDNNDSQLSKGTED
jgi:hypothetical protein